MIEAAIMDGSDNLLCGFSSTQRAEEFMRWLIRRAPEALADIRLIAYEADGAPILIYPREVI